MGLIVTVMIFVYDVRFAYPLLVIVGAMAGFFVVPMNALLQHRGHVLMSAGHSIAVQNFNENLNILFMLALYACLVAWDVSINTIIVGFGLFVAFTMVLVMRWYAANVKQHGDLSHLIGEEKHGGH